MKNKGVESRKNKYDMKQTIRAIIAMIPLAKPLYHELEPVAEKRLEQKRLMSGKEMK